MHTAKLDCQDILSDAVNVELRARLGPSKPWSFKCLWAQPTKSLKACIPTHIALIHHTIGCKQGVYAVFITSHEPV